MTRVTAATRRFARRQAIRAMAAPPAAAPPMRKPNEFETPLSPDEVEHGVRDGTFIAPGEFEPRRRDMQAGPGARYVTKGPGDDDLDDDDTGRQAA
jgi:hypothetical protein